MEGTFAVTAQSPSETRVLVCAADVSNLVKILFAADRTFDQRDVDFVGKILGVHQRAVDQINFLGEGNQGVHPCRETTCGIPNNRRAKPSPGGSCSLAFLPHQSQVGQELTALRASRRPTCPSRTKHRWGTRARTCRNRCRFLTMPHGWLRSVMTLASMPRPITSQVCAPSISSHTRTQRVHRMQRLWSTMKRSMRAIHLHLGIAVGIVDVRDLQALRQGLQFAVSV